MHTHQSDACRIWTYLDDEVGAGALQLDRSRRPCGGLAEGLTQIGLRKCCTAAARCLHLDEGAGLQGL